MWFIFVEVKQETSAPPPKKILDPLLLHTIPKTPWWNIYMQVYTPWAVNLTKTVPETSQQMILIPCF